MNQHPSNWFFYTFFFPVLLICLFSYYTSAHSAEAQKTLAPSATRPAPQAADLDQAKHAFHRLRAQLASHDRDRALEALHLALSHVADGGRYVWVRPKKQLRGIITLTASFRDAQGRVCRHLVYKLILGNHSKQAEGIACRNKARLWELSG